MKNSLIAFFLISFIQCRHQPKPSPLIIEETIILDSIPSASGMVLREDSLFIISDDAPYIYHLSLKNYGFEKIAIKGLDTNQYRIPKSGKPDFECATIVNIYGKEYLFALGSGSKSPERDSFLMMELTDNTAQSAAQLSDLYKLMQLSSNTIIKAWNIEAASVIGDSLYLLNRGNNLVFSISRGDFEGFMFSFQKIIPAVNYFKIKLPSIENHEAGFSGLAAIDNELGLFCASVEDAPDWISDGPILGSFVGIINMRTRQIISTYLLADSLGKPLIEKLESVELISKNNNGDISIIAVSDNDNGSSKLFRIKIPGK